MDRGVSFLFFKTIGFLNSTKLPDFIKIILFPTANVFLSSSDIFIVSSFDFSGYVIESTSAKNDIADFGFPT